MVLAAKPCPNCGTPNPPNYGVKFENSYPVPEHKCTKCGVIYQ